MFIDVGLNFLHLGPFHSFYVWISTSRVLGLLISQGRFWFQVGGEGGLRSQLVLWCGLVLSQFYCFIFKFFFFLHEAVLGCEFVIFFSSSTSIIVLLESRGFPI